MAAEKKQKQVLYDEFPLGPQPRFSVHSKWSDVNLTYAFFNGTPDIAGDGERQAVRDAMALWSAKSPLTFSETTPSVADIKISWAAGDHGDGFPFDGVNGVLAHAYYPEDGRIHFDDAESWTLGTRGSAAQPIDLVSVAAHELGHALGLEHSADPAALMYPVYTGSHRYLASDDFNGISAAYPSIWRLRNANSSGNPDISFEVGSAGLKRVTGDWNGDGTTTTGLYNPVSGEWALSDSHGGGTDYAFQFGGSAWTVPVTGDWDGNGTTTIGVYDPVAGNWNLRNSNSAGLPNHSFQYGGGAWTNAVTGDWDGNGTTTIGVYDPVKGNWNLRNSNSSGNPNYSFQYGGGAWTNSVTGDWDGNGTTTIGVYDPVAGNWNMRDANSSGNPDHSFQYGGNPWSLPVTGDWDGNGTDTVGVVRE